MTVAALIPVGAPDTIERKIRSFVQVELEKVPPAKRFTLYHLAHVHEKIFTAEQPKGKRVPTEIGDGIAKEILVVAREHQESFGSMQRYRLVAEGEDGSEHQRPCFFGLSLEDERRPREQVGADPVATNVVETAPAPALFKQLFEQNRSLSNLITEVLPQVVQQQARQIEILASENRRMLKGSTETEAVKQELLNQQRERDILLMREESTIKRQEETKRKLFDEIFPLVKKHFIRKYLPDDEVADKILGEAKDKANDNDFSAEEIRIAEAQAVFRELLKIIGRPAIEEALPPERRAIVDDLVGMTKVSSLADIKKKAFVLYSESDRDKFEAMQDKVVAEKKASLLKWLVEFIEE